jgi:L-threonylcarbamoyladenylate synthase
MSNNKENLLNYVKNIPENAQNIMEKHFPGALTLIFEKSDKTPDFITSGKNTVGIRVPDNAFFAR